MIEDNEDQRLRRIAERRADAKLGFRTHLLVYVIVNAGLVAINLMTNPDGYLWFPWAMLGWGLGLVAHGVSVYAYVGDHRERMIEEELARLRRPKA
ncbi:2TM domain-containing protein [Phenylobacterium sp.]|uniref:2TM domain-containing protein n=1 Tax=Phenylobacterium sp. TaxID=1871053 RepID=UPI0027365CED|nr:2TM domain-containing protein [Phenylobacterium sp.]MDP3852910.1 2TM domain-containing protein [Phenylobacterium sp.]